MPCPDRDGVSDWRVGLSKVPQLSLRLGEIQARDGAQFDGSSKQLTFRQHPLKKKKVKSTLVSNMLHILDIQQK